MLKLFGYLEIIGSFIGSIFFFMDSQVLLGFVMLLNLVNGVALLTIVENSNNISKLEKRINKDDDLVHKHFKNVEHEIYKLSIKINETNPKD